MPALKTILSDLVANQLSIDDYPSVIPMPASMSSSTGASSARRREGKGSARKKKGGGAEKWSRTGTTQSSSGGATHYTGGRNLVFMVGGLSYSELRVCREIMQKESKEIIAGSTAFVSPNEFMTDLATLN